jgi:hypothetical protein
MPVADAPPGLPFTVAMRTRSGKRADIDLVIEKVLVFRATVWRRGNARVEYEPNACQPPEVVQLRFVAGEDAVGYPLAVQRG